MKRILYLYGIKSKTKILKLNNKKYYINKKIQKIIIKKTINNTQEWKK
ncbi:hypothetical protein QGA_3674 [Clostridioides difficile CD181]|nr:hypothetical protein QCA_3375 [Clostridioides difficile CD40]EQF51312.1 hypothetical protein QGA_3674 [Clostridioides difficile CD181]EQH58481.1 hypothetical protein QMK_3398 [Clostridioides difficile DA00273]